MIGDCLLGDAKSLSNGSENWIVNDTRYICHKLKYPSHSIDNKSSYPTNGFPRFITPELLTRGRVRFVCLMVVITPVASLKVCLLYLILYPPQPVAPYKASFHFISLPSPLQFAAFYWVNPVLFIESPSKVNIIRSEMVQISPSRCTWTIVSPSPLSTQSSTTTKPR